ncbi:uncharacterized protein LOC114269849 [Camellia sinensis]|uniref:uncharacterized protein LOC114269849 n=1 Tax=Camellia sinensis TaxID=4442 RepID=UPI0010356B1D|nr:uncharacterized protein LOC114269849 [Camellia sinensis]
MEDDRDWGPKPFRFLNAWILHPTFMKKIKFVWVSTQVEGWAGYRLKIKLKSLKKALKAWNNEVFGNVESKLKEVEDATHALDLTTEERPLQEHEVLSRREIKGELWKLRKIRIRNTRYFHIMATQRQSRNLMESITIKGNTYNTPKAMKQEVARYFGEAFAETWLSRPKLRGVFKMIEPFQNELLLKDFSESKVKAIIKEGDRNKAPGPDGFNLICIQKGWNFMKFYER